MSGMTLPFIRVAIPRALRHASATLVAAAAVASTSCRAHVIWSGAEFQPDGTLRLAAEEPFCGCLRITNSSQESVHLRSRFANTTVGEATLAPGEQLAVKFD